MQGILSLETLFLFTTFLIVIVLCSVFLHELYKRYFRKGLKSWALQKTRRTESAAKKSTKIPDPEIRPCDSVIIKAKKYIVAGEILLIVSLTIYIIEQLFDNFQAILYSNSNFYGYFFLLLIVLQVFAVGYIAQGISDYRGKAVSPEPDHLIQVVSRKSTK